MVVVSEFDEWRVVVHSPEIIMQGQRQFKEAKAKEHAIALVRSYFQDVKQLPSPDLPELEWVPTGSEDWLVWKVS